MMNKQLAFVKSGLGLALCFLMVGAGVTPPIHASNANVSISFMPCDFLEDTPLQSMRLTRMCPSPNKLRKLPVR